MKPAGLRPCLYFGTFNPIHSGHLMIAQAVLNQTQLNVNRIFFVPAGSPPHRNHEADLADAMQRLEMVRLATSANPSFLVLEDEIYKQSNSYTIETVEELLKQGVVEPPVPLIIGSDALANLNTWHRAESLVKLVRFLQMPRPGLPFVTEMQAAGNSVSLNTQAIEMPMLSLSSSWIRGFLQQNKGDCTGLRYFVPEPVRSYIQDNGLYI